MKYIKMLMLAVVATLFTASCSDDEDINSTNATVGFETETATTKESAGMINIPIKVEGLRNGAVKVNIAATPAAENGAVEGKNFAITDKTLNLNADTASTGTLNVEMEIIDDKELNDDRSFTLTITSAEGATIKTKTTTVTIRDNESMIYEQFFGSWTLEGKVETNDGANNFSSPVTISGATDETSPDYDKTLTVTAPSFINIGAALDLEWKLAYTFDKEASKGTLGIVCGQQVASFNTYKWAFFTSSDGENLGTDPLTADWALENDALPSTITFSTASPLYFYGGQSGKEGVWAIYSDLKLVKK